MIGMATYACGTEQRLRAFFASTCYRSKERPRDLARSSMSLLENIKKIAGKVTGRGRPSENHLAAVVRHRKAHRFRFKDDGVIPNHPKWPLVLYRSALRLPNSLDPAAVLEDLFERNGWDDSWRDGIYDYLHYHSRIHEVLGIARGNARVQFGGQKGRTLALKAGDVAILPAGTGHQCLAASKDFLVVGAYPPSDIRRVPHVQQRTRAGPDHHSESRTAAQRPGIWKGRPASPGVEAN
jgi:uncharacterized protein YjlB